MVTFTVDSKGRLSIPTEVRDELGIECGDVLSFESDPERAVIHLAKAQTPFDGLAEHAIEEYRKGRTISLQAYADKHNIDPTDE